MPARSSAILEEPVPRRVSRTGGSTLPGAAPRIRVRSATAARPITDPVRRVAPLDPGSRLTAPSGGLGDSRHARELLKPELQELQACLWSSNATGQTPAEHSFHDHQALPDGAALVLAGCAAEPGASAGRMASAAESVLNCVRQVAARDWQRWHGLDTGRLLSRTGRRLWAGLTGGQMISLAAARLDPRDGQVSISACGESVVLRIRASSCLAVAVGGSRLGSRADADYGQATLELRPRERLALVVGPAAANPRRLARQIGAMFAKLDAESHRNMTPGEALRLIATGCCQAVRSGRPAATSIAVIRRR